MTGVERVEQRRPRGQRCILGLKRDIVRERATHFDGQTDQRTYPVTEMRERKSNISNEFHHIFSRDEATLYERVSVRRLVGWSIRPSVRW